MSCADDVSEKKRTDASVTDGTGGSVSYSSTSSTSRPAAAAAAVTDGDVTSPRDDVIELTSPLLSRDHVTRRSQRQQLACQHEVRSALYTRLYQTIRRHKIKTLKT